VKDLDFDELDKAVNSLITDKSNSNNSDNTNKKAFDINPGPARTPINSHFAAPRLPIMTPSVNMTPTNTLSPSMATRRSTGRFMDVVHPSSDMRTSLVMPKRTSREGATINPPIADITPSVTLAPEPVKPAVDDNWPDPIDFKNTASEIDTSVKDEDGYDDEDIDKISDDIDNTLSNQMPNEPQDSPFLSGAKVEKRPLGAFSNEPASSVIEQPNPDTTAEKPVQDSDNMSSYAQSVNEDEPLPDELQDNLLLIEAGHAPTSNAVTTNDKPVMALKTDGPTSISQQYQEQPSTGDQDSGAIYDTNSYHKAVFQPAKKKSGWLWVLWIVILLIVGAGAGAAIYFWVLPLL